MTTVGQVCLLCAFVGSGYAAFASLAGRKRNDRFIARGGHVAALASVLALSTVSIILAWALATKDFRFKYVADYSSGLLPWHYSLSAFWVGQAGSLLLWAWFSGVLALVYRFWPARQTGELREAAFGVQMGFVCFLVAIMVFAADPMRPSLAVPDEGAGLSPLLQHPAMLIHPPIVFLGYAGWAIPFALAASALLTGQLGTDWVRQARPWALFSWVVLGAGILVGADWAYEELGWGGYWGWDPVENGSLIPWLTGTALIHLLMVWQYRGALKKTAISLAIATFGLCNFATFLTRSGIFSSLHAFSQSPIGWMFLLLMVVLALGGAILVVKRRAALVAETPFGSVWARESLILISAFAWLLLAAVAVVGTLSLPLSSLILGRKMMVGTAFYNNVLIPTGLLLLATTALAPVTRWGSPTGASRRCPTSRPKALMLLSVAAGGVSAAVVLAVGVRHPITLAVAGLAGLAAVALVGSFVLDVQKRDAGRPWLRGLKTLRDGRRQYAGFLIHVGFVCLAIGVTGSSLGTRRHEVELSEGDTIEWAGRSIHFARLIQRRPLLRSGARPDKLVVEAQLQIARRNARTCTLQPAQHLHWLQNEWTTEVAIHSSWSGDFYTILHGGEGRDTASFTFVENPMMRWIWLGGWIAGSGALLGLWPARKRSAGRLQRRVPRPLGLFRRRRPAAAGESRESRALALGPWPLDSPSLTFHP